MQTSEVRGKDELRKSAITNMSHEVIKKTSEVFLLGGDFRSLFC